MFNFNESSRINLGTSGSGPYICSSYCILNDRLILSLYEPNSKKGKIAAYSISSSGTFTEVASSEVYPSGPYNIAHTDGIFTDGTYIYQCLTTEEVSNNKYTLAWGFSGDTFIYPTVITNYIHGSHQQMVFSFGSDYIFTYSTESYSSPNRLVVCKFNGSAWNIIASTDEVTLGYPLFSIYDRVTGIREDYGSYLSVTVTYDEDYGLQTDDYYGGYVPNRPWLIESLSWNLLNNSVKVYDYDDEYFYNQHTFVPALPGGLAYHSPQDNVFTICTVNGLYGYEAENPYRTYGVYEPSKSFYFNFKFGKFDIILDNDLVGGRYQMKSGRFTYCPDFNTKFYARHTYGNNPLTVLFVDTSK